MTCRDFYVLVSKSTPDLCTVAERNALRVHYDACAACRSLVERKSDEETKARGPLTEREIVSIQSQIDRDLSDPEAPEELL